MPRHGAVTGGVDYRRRCKCRCNARTTCGSRAAPRDSSLSPLCRRVISSTILLGPDLCFSCTRKIHLVVRHTGLSLRHNRIVPLSRSYGSGFIVRSSPLEILAFASKRRAIIPRAPFRAFNCPPKRRNERGTGGGGKEGGKEKRESERASEGGRGEPLLLRDAENIVLLLSYGASANSLKARR